MTNATIEEENEKLRRENEQLRKEVERLKNIEQEKKRIEKEFEEFWHETVDNKRSVAWTGTKKKALEYWVKLRKKHSFDFLMSQRDDYFQYLRLQKQMRKFDQQRLMCQVFLNPANERYMENYADYIAQLKKHYGDPEVVNIRPVTKEEILNQYGKNNNK